MEQTRKEILLQEIQTSNLAELAQAYLGAWVQEYQEWIIGNLKVCKASSLLEQRSLLVASEAFLCKMKADIERGLEAHQELKFIEEEETLNRETKNNDYWE